MVSLTIRRSPSPTLVTHADKADDLHHGMGITRQGSTVSCDYHGNRELAVSWVA